VDVGGSPYRPITGSPATLRRLGPTRTHPNTGPGGTGNAVRMVGYEEWTIDEERLSPIARATIAASSPTPRRSDDMRFRMK